MQFSLLAYCRAGFESDMIKELQYRCSELGVYGYGQFERQSGYACFMLTSATDVDRIFSEIPLKSLIFVRQWMKVLAVIDDLPKNDRVSAVLQSVQDFDLHALGGVSVDFPESMGEAALGRFCRKFTSPLASALRKQHIVGSGIDKRRDHLCVFLASFEQAYVGLLINDNRSDWHLGIPRLRFPADAPSRSTLKLEEAWHVFIGKELWLHYLGGHKTSVDLGAAPGGWTWQLVNQGMDVIAVDNGPMNEQLMQSGHVTHMEADGFVYQPHRSVDWMVCDIVDKPKRVADMLARWFENRWCRYSVFNLKLPMKKRYDEVVDCLALIDERLRSAGIKYRLMTKHLYHDREEVSCFYERLD